jgi:hypothetical protein
MSFAVKLFSNRGGVPLGLTDQMQKSFAAKGEHKKLWYASGGHRLAF